MPYFVTGATGFIGRHLVAELVDHREGTVFVLCREASLPRMEALISSWGSDRVVPVVGDLAGSASTRAGSTTTVGRSTTSSTWRRSTT
jgi:thioester reductase-like protein